MVPYNPEHVSKGGNRSTVNKDLKAPVGKYRVVSVDTFDGGDYVVGDYKDKKEAFKVAGEKSGTMCIAYVFNSRGEKIYKAGTF
jgi:hypothetical protein